MSILVTVNGDSLSVVDALRRSIIHNEEFLQNAIDGLLVEQYAESKGIRNTDAELQLAADELRYQHGLESVEKLNQWIKQNNQTPLSLQNSVEFMLLRNKVRYSIPDTEIAAYYAEHKKELEEFELYSIRVSNADLAAELASQIADGADFHALAREHSEDKTTSFLGGYVGNLTRSRMSGEIEAVVTTAKPNSVAGPVKTGNGFNLFKVGSIGTPSLGDSKESIRATLFDQLLEKLRSESKIAYPVLSEAAAA